MGTFILGAPDETREEIKNTLEFAKKLDIDIPQFNLLSTYPGTAIWDELSFKGVLDEEKHWETGVDVSRIYPTPVPYREIVDMIKKAVTEFTLRPGFLLNQIGRTLLSPYRRGVLLHNLVNMGKVLETIRNPPV
jgi:radical SAM superfamily enzyme YgiQ (UPF0313 family)